MSRANLLKNIVKGSITEDKMLDRYLMSRGINPLHVTRDTKVSHSKSGEFLKWKNDHVNESADKKDTVTFDIPLIIRVLELAREDIKSDMDLHRVVERLIDMRNKGVLTMDDYDFIAGIKESVTLDGISIVEVSSELLDRYKTGAKKSADDLTAQGKHKKSTDRWMNIMKATGKQIDKTTASIKKSLNKEEVIEEGNSNDNHQVGYRGVGGARYREDDEYHNEPKPKFKPRNVMDRPHTVHIDNKPWKKFDNGHQAHAAAKTLQSKGKNAVAIAHFNESAAFGRFKKAVKKSGYDMDAGAKRLEDLLAKQKKEREEREAKENVKEDVYQDPQAATQTVFDGGNNTDDTKAQRSKSARIIKSIYKRQGVKEEVVSEEMYDHEKEDKSTKTLGKKNDDKEPAAAVLKGGKTMTGTTRDTVEIDPAMRLRPGQPDPTKATPQKR